MQVNFCVFEEGYWKDFSQLVGVVIEASQNFIFYFSITRQKNNFKNIGAYTEGTDLIFKTLTNNYSSRDTIPLRESYCVRLSETPRRFLLFSNKNQFQLEEMTGEKIREEENSLTKPLFSSQREAPIVFQWSGEGGFVG
jgi:hypothetical protein